MKYYVVDAFTQKPFGGNPAGVVILRQNEPFPDEKLMIKIAAELRYSETAFVRQDGVDEFTIRYFTPAAEVDLCGHATIATFSVLRDKGIIKHGSECCSHTHAADLNVTVGSKIMMQMAPPKVIDYMIDELLLHKIMHSSEVPPYQKEALPVEIISTGLPDIIMPVGSIEQLQAIEPDMEALKEFSKQLQVVGVHAFTLSEDNYTAHVRNFAPLYAVPEESATGTANAALTYYLYRHGVINAGSECNFIQGEAMKRPSTVATKLCKNEEVYVGGDSYILAEGEIHLPKESDPTLL